MKKLAPGYYEGEYKGVKFTITKIEGQNEWYFQINNKPAEDIYYTKKYTIYAAEQYIDYIQTLNVK
jgi:hypothetical protein